jgi:maleylacetate reductase
MTLIVRWGLDELRPLLSELGIARPLLVASNRWQELDLPAVATWSEIPSHRIAAPEGVDGVLAVGGGSAIDTAKAASAAAELPLVSVPTTYSGSEWTAFFGVRDPDKRMVGGGGGARLAGIVYEPALTLGLPRAPTGGTAMNALAHCVEALYPGDLAVARRGAALIVEWLPRVLDAPDDLEARTRLLEGACLAGEALALHGLGLGHAMAQAIGGRYGLPHGALNAICLPAAMRFNAEVVPEVLDVVSIETAESLKRLAGFDRLRDLGVPERDLDELGIAVEARPGARANPRRATVEEIVELLRSVW